jgi:hypothetical protein
VGLLTNGQLSDYQKTTKSKIVIYQNLYCKVFLDYDFNQEKLIQMIATLTGDRIEFKTVLNSYCEIGIKRNEDFHDIQRHEYPDGFLYYSYYLDIEPVEEVEFSSYVEVITNLLEQLWSKGFQAVAACDFEEDLPRKGGYKWGN